MKIEEQDLLLKDLCSRLPYGVKCQIKGEEDFEPLKLKSFIQGKGFYAFDFYIKENLSLTFKELDEFKPYLFPLSSMTEEQDREFSLLQVNTHKDGFLYVCDCANMMKWLLKNHFDIYGLIEKGLAIDASGLNIY